jgi:hypothetical protein
MKCLPFGIPLWRISCGGYYRAYIFLWGHGNIDVDYRNIFLDGSGAFGN